MVFQSKYSGKGYNSKPIYNPTDLMDPDLKANDPVFFRRKMEYLYHCWLNDLTVIPYSSLADIRINRLYAAGMQPVTKYMDQLCPIKPGTKERESWVNISWDIYSVAPKFRSFVMGLFDKVDYAVNVWGVDEQSSDDRNSLKFHAWAESRSRAFLDEFDQQAGLDSQSSLPFDPESLETLEMLDKIGTFKTATEIGIKKCLLKSQELSEWDELKKRFHEDSYDTGYIACSDETDPVTGEIKTEYVDPEYFLAICKTGRMNNYEDIISAARIKCWTLQDLRNYGLPEEVIKRAAMAYQGQFGNPALSSQYLSPGTGMLPDRNLSEIKVWGLDGEFESLNTYYYELRNVQGHDQAVPFKLPFTPTKPEAKKGTSVMQDNKRKWLRCKWIIGTDIIFDHGYQFDVPYEQKSKPRSKFHVYKIQERSLQSLINSQLDDLMMTVLRFRAWWNEAAPPGLLVELNSLQNITLGGQKLEPLDLLQIRRDKGHLIYKAFYNPVNGAVMTGGPPPVTELKGGLQNGLDECVQKMALHINNIRDLLGIGAVTDGSTPNPNVPVGTSKIAEAGTNYVLRPVLSAYKYIKKRAFSNMALRWQLQMRALQARNNSIPETFAEGISTLYREIIAMGVNPLSRMGIFVDTLIDDDYRARIMNSASESLKAAKAGAVGITQRDFFVIERMVESGQLEIAEMYLAYRERKEKEFQLKKENDMMRANSESAAAQQQAKDQGVIAIENAKAQREISVAIIKHLLEKDRMQEAYKLQGADAVQAPAAAPAA